MLSRLTAFWRDAAALAAAPEDEQIRRRIVGLYPKSWSGEILDRIVGGFRLWGRNGNESLERDLRRLAQENILDFDQWRREHPGPRPTRTPPMQPQDILKGLQMARQKPDVFRSWLEQRRPLPEAVETALQAPATYGPAAAVETLLEATPSRLLSEFAFEQGGGAGRARRPPPPQRQVAMQIEARVLDAGEDVFVGAPSCPLVRVADREGIIYCKTGQTVCAAFRGVMGGFSQCAGKQAQQQLRPGDTLTVQTPDGGQEEQQVQTIGPDGRVVVKKTMPGMVQQQPLQPQQQQPSMQAPAMGIQQPRV